MGIMEIVLPAVVCFAITAVVGRLLIPALRRLKAGQSIKRDGPVWHMSKEGTPTMGGLIFIAGIGGMALKIGPIKITNIAVALILGIITNAILSRKKASSEDPDENENQLIK